MEKSELPATPVIIQTDGIKLEFLHAKRLDSYQTHYIMNYPPEGEKFIQIEIAIEGVADPEAWGAENLTLSDSEVHFEPVHIRRILVSEQYEYLADEDFQFHYQFFFSTPEATDPTELSLVITDQAYFPLAKVMISTERELRAIESSQEPKPRSGEFSVIAGGSSNQALATHTTVSGGQLNRAAVAYATVGGGRENNASYF